MIMRCSQAISCIIFALAFGGCVEIPPGVGGYGGYSDTAAKTTITPAGVFPALDPGAKDVTGLHFEVHAYGSDRANEISLLVEAQYNKIMGDTNLYSFQPPGLYSIVVYGTRDEFLRKTRQPQWSGGVTVGNAIYSYESPGLPMILAHEMTHLIFHEYMGSPRMDLRWLNEGLAVYEEQSRGEEMGLIPAGSGAERRNTLRNQAIPFDQMVNLTPQSEKDRTVSIWYQQVGDVVRMLVERGGHNGFGQFLSQLRDNRTVDDSLRAGFPGLWNNMPVVEAAWKGTL